MSDGQVWFIYEMIPVDDCPGMLPLHQFLSYWNTIYDRDVPQIVAMLDTVNQVVQAVLQECGEPKLLRFFAIPRANTALWGVMMKAENNGTTYVAFPEKVKWFHPINDDAELVAKVTIT